MIYVSDRKQARLSALDLVTMTHGDNNPKKFLQIPSEELTPFLQEIKEKNLNHVLQFGIGYIYEGQTESERKIVE